MKNCDKFYINGSWVDPKSSYNFDLLHPANEEKIASIAMGSKLDVDEAVNAAKKAFVTWQFSSIEERVDLLNSIMKVYKSRSEEFIKTMSYEMGTTISFSREVQMPVGIGHLEAAIEALKSHQFERPSPRGGSTLVDEPVGICLLYTSPSPRD